MLHIAGGRIIYTGTLPRSRDKEKRPSPIGDGEGQSSQILGRRSRSASDSEDDPVDNLSWAPRKKAYAPSSPLGCIRAKIHDAFLRSRSDPLISHGRHFGRTVHAFCRPFTLLKEGLSRQLQIQAEVLNEDDLSEQEQREHGIFQALLAISPGLDRRLLTASADELHYVAEMINKGATGARAGDIKALKSAIIDWIGPPGGYISPPLSRNVKTDRGFFHMTTGALLCPATLDWDDASTREKLKSGELSVTGDVWPTFLYHGGFNADNPWEGLLKGDILVLAYKYVFTSPSSVDNETRATRSGNAEIHGMKGVTIASVAYIATLQVRFALSSSAVFSRNDRSTDSERFYKSIIDWLESPSEIDEVGELLRWWNR
ncbi:hypothetical protein FA13DRAFT_1648706 [Coprinellus micaceus]|uniref:Uncharacterized protein n=1 Tax=Coprinellus micaceus TaxID=71717 RepID=A0A4Y7SAE7_COPMI|nr:hypothetical protein FA13DRAFT_1648706 [Coprinellus micaceus]